jgi:hypothetical protein
MRQDPNRLLQLLRPAAAVVAGRTDKPARRGKVAIVLGRYTAFQNNAFIAPFAVVLP